MAGRAVRFLIRGGQGIIAAFQLLTRLPFPVQVPYDRPTLAAGSVCFPLAGAAIGLLTAGAGSLFLLALPPLPAAALTLAVWIGLSGGLHLDGWLDTADGTLSHRSRERMLAIMKDSRVGAMGVLAGVLLLLVKFAALASLFEHQQAGQWALPLAAIPIWSRWWMTAAIAGWPYAREGEEGMGAMFRGVRAVHAAGAAAVGLVLTLLLLLLGEPLLSAAVPGLPHAAQLLIAAALYPAAALLFGLPLAIWLARKLGGQTGDTYGAMNEWTEAGLLLLLAAILERV